MQIESGARNENVGFRPLDEELFRKKSQGPENEVQPKDGFKSDSGEDPATKGLMEKMGKLKAAQPNARDWTVLCYFNGNCDLQSDMEESMKALEQTGSDDHISFVAQMARGDHGGEAQRILLKKPSFMGMKKNSEVMGELGKTNMAHPQTLKDFISWGMQKFPAQHYMVLLNGHGMGFLGCLPDDTSNDFMMTPELKSALDVATKESGKKIDVLGFDSCLMANAETAYAAKDAANFLVGSEEVLVSGNWDYGEFSGKMKEKADKGDLPVGEALEAMLNAQHTGTLLTSSVINCMKMPEFAGKLKDFSDRLLVTDTPESTIRRAFRSAQHYCQPEVMAHASNGDVNTKPMDQMRDVASVALEIARSPGVKDAELKKAAIDLADFTVKKAVIFEMHRKGIGLSDSGGMSIYAPASEGGKYADFYENKISLSQDTGWGKVVRKFGA